MTQQKRIGRPKLPERLHKVRLTICLDRDVYNHLRRIGGNNLSKAANDSIRLTMPHIEQTSLTTVDTSS